MPRGKKATMQDEFDIPLEADQCISVEIYDQMYNLRGTDATYIRHLARLVDAKMRAVASQSGTVDSLRVAVLASLNIADELVCMRDRYNQLAGSITQSQSAMRSRSASLTSMLDEVFDETVPIVRRAG
jgi:cell division protein ZapA